MNTQLHELKKQVFNKGLNIYALINRLEKLRGNPIPDSCVQILCEEFLKQKDKIKDPFAWSITVLKLKADEINAQREMAKKKVYQQTNTKLLKELFK